MKTELFALIDKYSQALIDLGNELFRTPELGYKEFKTKKILVNKFKEYGIEVEKEYFETGFQVTIGEGKPHIGLFAELDALPVPEHPFASKKDGAAHVCGHSTQLANMFYAFLALKESGILKMGGKITLFFTPAEEFTDLEYRRNLIKEHKIKHIGGKINMLEAGVFNDLDCIIHLHAMGGKYAFNYGSSLAGFKYKKIIFKGVAAHAGVLPHKGINALNEFTLFNAGLGMLRETFEDDKMIRVHGYVTKGGNTINSIPSEVIYECYIRSLDYHKLWSIDRKISNLAMHCAKALGGEALFEDMNGYMPFIPNAILSEVAHQNILNFAEKENIYANEKSIAGGDVGDVACFYPMIQFGYNGFSGTIHGSDFKIVDNQKAYIEPTKIICGIVADLLANPSLVEKIKETHHSIAEAKYLTYLND